MLLNYYFYLTPGVELSLLYFVLLLSVDGINLRQTMTVACPKFVMRANILAQHAYA